MKGTRSIPLWSPLQRPSKLASISRRHNPGEGWKRSQGFTGRGRGWIGLENSTGLSVRVSPSPGTGTLAHWTPAPGRREAREIKRRMQSIDFQSRSPGTAP